jgi:hypothetical protein
MDISVQSQLITLEDLAEVQAEGYAKNYSTVAEYHAAGIDPSLKNNASKHIEAGREPFLLSRDAVEMGVHPFIAVHDVDIKKQDDGKVGITTPKNTYWLEPDTIIAWR